MRLTSGEVSLFWLLLDLSDEGMIFDMYSSSYCGGLDDSINIRFFFDEHR